MNVKWEQHKLGEVVSVFDGTHQTPNYKTKGIMFLSVENINTLLSNKYISENEYRQRFKIKPQYLDVFMTRIGTIGKTNVITTHKPIAYYVSLALLRPQNIQSFFLSFIIQTSKVQQDIWKRTLQIAFPQKINKDEIGKVTLALPLQKEQIDIEKLLLKLDKLITLQQRKLEQLKLLEKAHQQKLFPNSFQEKPLLRILHGDNSWWNSYIGEVFTERVDKGSSEKLLSVSITDGVYPFDESKRKNNSSDDKHNYKKSFSK
nr:restriction endonuclease subunit S [Limosilactobacillus reuteri]